MCLLSLQELSVMYHVKTGLNGDSVPPNGEGAALEHVWLWVVTMNQLDPRVRDKKLNSCYLEYSRKTETL